MSFRILRTDREQISKKWEELVYLTQVRCMILGPKHKATNLQMRIYLSLCKYDCRCNTHTAVLLPPPSRSATSLSLVFSSRWVTLFPDAVSALAPRVKFLRHPHKINKQTMKTLLNWYHEIIQDIWFISGVSNSMYPKGPLEVEPGSHQVLHKKRFQVIQSIQSSQ